MGSGYHSFAVGEVLTAANVMNYLMTQTVMSFASAAAAEAAITSPQEGMVIYVQDVDIYRAYTGTEWRDLIGLGEWRTYTPAWTSSGTQPSLGNGARFGRYIRHGQTVTFAAEIIMGSTTAFGNGNYSLSLPVNARTANPTQYLMTRVGDASSGQAYAGQTGALLQTTVPLQVQGAADLDGVTNTVPITLASGDTIRTFGTYEAELPA
ncbi:hypothetical protein [Actinomadura sp. 9N215]|uniref:hypothetical protein n=1 Tax=Actinomadura sp. 9N215 TaxID=3375150 RepID=UPI003792EA07